MIIGTIKDTRTKKYHALDGLGFVKHPFLARQYSLKMAKKFIKLHEKNGVWKKDRMKYQRVDI